MKLNAIIGTICFLFFIVLAVFGDNFERTVYVGILSIVNLQFANLSKK